MTRKLTHSKFDHVALILKFDVEEDEVFFLDATSIGVTVNRWSKFKSTSMNFLYHIFYRQLISGRDDRMIDALDTFMKTTIGNKYNLSLKEILFKKTTQRQGIDMDLSTDYSSIEAEDLDNRQFFCSELVAKAYKVCGLINTERASCQFLPADFSSCKLSKLENGSSLKEELLIVMDKKG